MLDASDFSRKQIVFLITKDGDRLSFQNDKVIIKDKNGKMKHQSTCYRLLCCV